MSEKNQTITGGLGLESGYFEQAANLVKKKLADLDTISDALESVAEVVRDEELGETNFRVSDYEKKLILCGFVMGCIRSEAEMSHKLDELKMVFHLMMMSKQVGKDPSGNPILGGILNAKDLPKELKDFLDKMSGGDSDDD